MVKAAMRRGSRLQPYARRFTVLESERRSFLELAIPNMVGGSMPWHPWMEGARPDR